MSEYRITSLGAFPYQSIPLQNNEEVMMEGRCWHKQRIWSFRTGKLILTNRRLVWLPSVGFHLFIAPLAIDSARSLLLANSIKRDGLTRRYSGTSEPMSRSTCLLALVAGAPLDFGTIVMTGSLRSSKL